jgi:CMP-N-acetylneuraminic acid synthetase
MEKHGEYFDAVCLLQPTCPLRRAEDIDGCIELMEQRGADTVFTVLELPESLNPFFLYFRADDGTPLPATGDTPMPTRRQDLPRAVRRNGTIYVIRRDVLRMNRLYGAKLAGYPLAAAQDLNIDSLADWERAEQLLCQQPR